MPGHRSLFLLLFFLSNLLNISVPGDIRAMPPLDMGNAPASPDYSMQESWLSRPVAPAAPVDVFYVYPTVLFDDLNWMLNPADTQMRIAAQHALDTQAVVFEGMANIYAPMYRQMNIAGLGLSDTDAAPLKKAGYDDVLRAFNYYLEHENNGRPFFLAGHSQGSMILTNVMIASWGTFGVEDKLVAALLPGWSLTPEDLSSNPALTMCDTSVRTGCVISYNTMAEGRQSVAPTLKKNALAVNPLSWKMDGALVDAQEHLGAVFFDANAVATLYPHFTSAQIVKGALIVHPQDVHLVTVKGGHFPEGVYHAYDYSLFFENIKANIQERIEAHRLR